MRNKRVASFHQCAIVAMAVTVFMAGAESVFAQQGYSSTAMARSRSGQLPGLDTLRIEELFNYHDHRLPLPEGEQRVQLDLRGERISETEAVLQVGISTPRALDHDTMRPLNLVLVIDQSGSMSGRRIKKVKQALMALVEKLRSQDRISIVGFHQQAKIHLTACQKTRVGKIIKAIQSIEASGSTNLHDGLMEGYRQASEHLDPKYSNRVILLSDGLTNQGETDPEKIAKSSKQFNRKGIDLSTIGLGKDFNESLLRQLADAGRGSFHFVADEQDIEKTFVQEIDSLLVPAARQVKLTLDLGDFEDFQIYGYREKANRKGSRAKIRLDNLNCGTTQVVMLRIKDVKRFRAAKVKLSYEDAVEGESQQLKGSWSAKQFPKQHLHNTNIRKNFLICELSQSIERGLELAHQEKILRASREMKRANQMARKYFKRNQDADVERLIDIARQFRKRIERQLAKDEG